MSHILVVDDYPVTLKVISHKLQHNGHQVTLASNGRQALEILMGAGQTPGGLPPVDLAIVDIAMPEMDGITLLQHIRSSVGYQQIPIIILTASGLDSDRTAAELSGASAFLTKPVSTWELSETVTRLLEAPASPTLDS